MGTTGPALPAQGCEWGPLCCSEEPSPAPAGKQICLRRCHTRIAAEQEPSFSTGQVSYRDLLSAPRTMQYCTSFFQLRDLYTLQVNFCILLLCTSFTSFNFPLHLKEQLLLCALPGRHPAGPELPQELCKGTKHVQCCCEQAMGAGVLPHSARWERSSGDGALLWCPIWDLLTLLCSSQQEQQLPTSATGAD